MAIQVYSVTSGKELLQLPGVHSRVYSINFSPDGSTLVSGSEDHRVRLWEVSTGAVVREFVGHEGPVLTVTFSPDGVLLASGSEDRTARLWDVETGTLLATFEGHKGWVTCVAISPDCNWLVTGSQDGSLIFWDSESAKPARKLIRHHASVESVAFSPDGKTLASGSWDKTVRLWDVATGEQGEKFVGHHGGVKSVAFSPDGTLVASGSGDHTVRLWPARGIARRRPPFTGHRGVVFSLAFSPDGATLVSGSEDRTIRLWDVATGKETRQLPENHGLVSAVAFSPDGRYLAAVNSGYSTMVFRKPPGLGSGILPAPGVAGPPDLEKQWADLTSADPRTALSATRGLAAAPQAVQFLKERVRPVPPATPNRIERWLREARGVDAAARNAACAELLRMGHLAEPALQEAIEALPEGPSRQRLVDLAAQLVSDVPPVEALRELRAVGVLQRIKTPEARQLIEALSQGEPAAPLTVEARLALKRLNEGGADR
jgi:sugar lactone lactonase YvrE